MDISVEASHEAAINYDKSFRQWRESDPKDCQWQFMNFELYHEALASGLKSKIKSATKFQPQQSFRSASGPNKIRSNRYCFDFNTKEGGCPRGQSCPYPHICQFCSGNHPKSKCSEQNQAKPAPTVRRGLPSKPTPEPKKETK